MREASRPEFFPQSPKADSYGSDSDKEELSRLIGNSEKADQWPNIYRLIDENKLEEIKSLIAKNADVLNVKDQSRDFPILYAIKNGNNDIALEFIRSTKRFLSKKTITVLIHFFTQFITII